MLSDAPCIKSLMLLSMAVLSFPGCNEAANSTQIYGVYELCEHTVRHFVFENRCRGDVNAGDSSFQSRDRRC